ncbi:MAG: amino acid ABC transporter substrate-binding protein [Alphaproteobacteria bacterium]|nr:amino acid ABC transporter substrate-binding protein [Alphaproteobacteria bacterium]MBV9016017.1 amino acid ABC transporter substrate-binding protein [Alphaproteobacteria bacterium]MBV9150433.1 amino acid ABC transporter substrate-binding protein [Alphaproteobacteria bacterium]MBV9585904.1 amino acid ABC transporter substrate-binding protein [Alphaproteobacteria bacterium]
MKTGHNRLTLSLLSAAVLLFGVASASPARAAEPIKIGTGMALTGGLAASGKAAILAMKIWEEEINAKGGLLGRPVQLVYYDDQSNPATVPGIFTKLLDVDKVDLICGDYGTNLLAPAMPVVIQHNMTFFALFGLDVNREFQYPRYFAMQPAGGPNPSAAFSQGFFEVAAAQNPKPKTLAIIAADAEFPHNAADGARENAKKAGLQIVYDKTYPPNTTDYTPIVRAVDAANPDVVFSASYPPDAVGIVRAANEIGLKTKLFGGGLVGLQYASIKQQLGPMLNGIVDYDFWEPAKTLDFPGVEEFLKKYQAKAPSEGVDPLGYYLPPFAYANLQVLQAAVEGTKSLDQDKLADWLRKNTIKTIVGDIAFGSNGEWKEARVLQIQFHDVKGSDLDQWKTDEKQTILWPDKYATGKAVYPYTDAKK